MKKAEHNAAVALLSFKNGGASNQTQSAVAFSLLNDSSSSLASSLPSSGNHLPQSSAEVQHLFNQFIPNSLAAQQIMQHHTSKIMSGMSSPELPIDLSSASGRKSRKNLSNITDQEKVRIMDRRKKNKEAAARCRQKRVDEIDRLEKDVEEENRLLKFRKSKIEELNKLKSVFNFQLQTHNCKAEHLIKEEPISPQEGGSERIERPNTLMTSTALPSNPPTGLSPPKNLPTGLSTAATPFFLRSQMSQLRHQEELGRPKSTPMSFSPNYEGGVDIWRNVPSALNITPGGDLRTPQGPPMRTFQQLQ